MVIDPNPSTTLHTNAAKVCTLRSRFSYSVTKSMATANSPHVQTLKVRFDAGVIEFEHHIYPIASTVLAFAWSDLVKSCLLVIADIPISADEGNPLGYS